VSPFGNMLSVRAVMLRFSNP